jgi:predicted ester cyclase
MESSTPQATIQDRLRWRVTPELYEKIRGLWISHSISEDQRNLQGLIDTLTEDCVYEIVGTDQRWEGHAGARQFYTSFLGAFPDIDFKMTDIAIGPQGVFEVANVSGTHKGEWAGQAPSGQRVNFQVIIFFPWNPQVEKFSGERIWVTGGDLRPNH